MIELTNGWEDGHVREHMEKTRGHWILLSASLLGVAIDILGLIFASDFPASHLQMKALCVFSGGGFVSIIIWVWYTLLQFDEIVLLKWNDHNLVPIKIFSAREFYKTHLRGSISTYTDFAYGLGRYLVVPLPGSRAESQVIVGKEHPTWHEEIRHVMLNWEIRFSKDFLSDLGLMIGGRFVLDGPNGSHATMRGHDLVLFLNSVTSKNTELGLWKRVEMNGFEAVVDASERLTLSEQAMNRLSEEVRSFRADLETEKTRSVDLQNQMLRAQAFADVKKRENDVLLQGLIDAVRDIKRSSRYVKSDDAKKIRWKTLRLLGTISQSGLPEDIRRDIDWAQRNPEPSSAKSASKPTDPATTP